MHEPFAHPMMARATHDELARQNFVASFKIHMEDEVYPENETVYRARVEPRFLREHNRPPANRHEVRRAMEREPFTQTWSSIARTLQEMMWDASGETVERQLPELIAKAKVSNPSGSLTLDTGLKVPSYNAAIDIHCMPGGYATDLCEDDIYAGALVDRGGYYYALPLQGKAAHEFRDSAEGLYRGAAARKVIRYPAPRVPGPRATANPRPGLRRRRRNAALRGCVTPMPTFTASTLAHLRYAMATPGPRGSARRCTFRSRTQSGPISRTGISI